MPAVNMDVMEVASINKEDMPEWARAARAMPSREGFIDVEGCAIHYIAWGDQARPPIVLIHGNAANAEWWRFIAPLLAADHHVIATDLPGMGDSAHSGLYDRERCARQIMAVADALAPRQKPLVVGHSLGGFVSIMVAKAYGDRMAGLIVLDSPPYEPKDSGPSPFVRSNPVPKIYPTRESALARYKVLPEQEVSCGFYLQHIAEHSIKPEAGGWRWKFDPPALSQPRPRDFVQDLLTMQCPVALMWGALSSRLDDRMRQFCYETFGGVLPVVEIPNARHHIMLDEPLALVAALRTQIANWKARGGSRAS
ncbi:alpha/beta fold hydrolase [Ottowia thiooxydans]|uniref:Pimeloyl-ACP methyl ester carboxylesterase n=1 Tax=Ottowia thiooxydans TaxID=219182 RepID=A0ABV2Q896_9BURK